MLLALGAVSSALDALQSLTSSKKSSSPRSTGFSQTPTNPFDVSGSDKASGSPAPAFGSNGFSQLSPATMSALLAAQSQSSTGSTTSASTSPSNALKDLFSQLDTNGDSKVSKSEFENALGAGGTNIAQADTVFSKMDSNGDGSVSLDEMASGLKANGRHRHHHLAGSDGSGGSAGTGGSNSDPLLQALQGASSTSVTNSDGSITTSLTYADGSKVTMTSAASGSTSSAATSSYNFIEQMIQRQAKAISASTTASLSVSA